MLKTTYEAVSIAITRKELLDAVRNFLLHSGSHKDVVLADNIYSPKFGSSDLLFVNKTSGEARGQGLPRFGRSGAAADNVVPQRADRFVSLTVLRG